MNRIVFFVLLAVIGIETPLLAEIIDVYITATVTEYSITDDDDGYEAYDPYSGDIQPGDMITGIYCYESEAVPFYGGGGQVEGTSEYQFSGSEYFVNCDIEGYNFRSNFAYEWFIGVSNNEMTDDWYTVTSSLMTNTTPFGDLEGFFYMEFADFSGEVLNDTGLPEMPLDIRGWDSAVLYISGYLHSDGSDAYSIRATVDTIAVPEPASLFLLAMGALAAIRRQAGLGKMLQVDEEIRNQLT